MKVRTVSTVGLEGAQSACLKHTSCKDKIKLKVANYNQSYHIHAQHIEDLEGAPESLRKKYYIDSCSHVYILYESSEGSSFIANPKSRRDHSNACLGNITLDKGRSSHLLGA